MHHCHDHKATIMRRKSAKNKELENDARLLGAWRKSHADQLEEALAGVHRDVMQRLMEPLKQLRSARELVDAISAEDFRDHQVA